MKASLASLDGRAGAGSPERQIDRLERRGFLRAAVAAAIPFDPGRTLGLDRLSVMTDEVAATPEQAILFAKQYRLRWVELRRLPGSGRLYAEMPPDEVRRVKKELDDNGLGVSFLNTWILKITLPGTDPLMRRDVPPEKWASRLRSEQNRFDQRMDYLRRAIEAAHILGVETIRVFTFWRVPDPLPLYDRIAAILAEMDETARRENVRLLIENESACNVATSAELVKMVDRLRRQAIGINWDPHNALPYEATPFPAGYRLLPKERIRNVQIKGESLLIAGEILDWRAIMHAMVADGYTGKFGLETHFGDGEDRFRNAHASMTQILRAAGIE